MNKKIASKLVVSSALVSSAFVSTINVDAAAQSSSAEKWVKEAENLAGTLKWAISIEGNNTDITEIPWDYYNQTKDALKKAREAIKSLPVKERTILETRLNENVELYVSTNPNNVGRVVAYIDAVTAGKKIEEKKKALAEKLQKNEIDDATEKAYHELSKEIRKQGILLDRVYGYSTRQIIRDHFKKSAEQVKEEALYPVSVKIEIDRANEATAAGKYEEAKKRLESAKLFLEKGIAEGFIKQGNTLFVKLSEKITSSKEYYETVIKAQNPSSGSSSGGGGGGYVPPADYIVNGTTATVRSVSAFERALGENAIKDIKLAASFGNTNKVYELNRIVNIDFGSYTLNGNLTIETDAEGTIELKGSAIPTINGNLTVNGSLLTVNNYLSVSGDINILDVKHGTWNENAAGNKLTIEDSDAIVNLNKNTGRITVKGNATESTKIDVKAGVTVASLVAESPVHITGEGVVAAAVINANVIMETLPERILVEDGVIIKKNTEEQYTSEELNTITDNKLVLEFIIEDAKVLNKNTVVGSKEGQVSQAAKDALGTAITTAESVLKNSGALPSDVTKAVTELEQAITTFEDAIVKPAPDTLAPKLVSVAPVKDTTVNLDHDKTFTLEVKAEDENLRELEIDHNLSSLPEFSVYASEENPYGDEKSKEAFKELGVIVTYNKTTQTWNIDFGKAVTSTIVEKDNVTFYMVLKDEAGNKWGDMDPTTAENTFNYKVTQAKAPDTVEPKLVSVTPVKDTTVNLDNDGTFTLEVVASDENLRELEIDHNLSSLPEFSVYASEDNPYGTPELKNQFEAQGVIVTYNKTAQTWNIDFGKAVTNTIVEKNNVVFYMVLKDESGNKWGSMSPTTPENTFKYTVTKADPAIAEVKTFEELKTAIESNVVKTVKIKNNIELEGKLQILSEKHIDGNGYTLTAKNTSEWDGFYALQFYKTTGSVKNIKITGADAAIYVNGSAVSLDGKIDVSGNHFGGIEVSKGSEVTTDPVLNMETAVLLNTSEANDKPTIWEDQIGTIESANRVSGYEGMKVDHNQKTATNVQRFYYLDHKFEAPKQVVNPAVANVTTFGELKTAIESEEVKTIKIKNNIELEGKLQILSEKHIDGNGFTLIANSPTGWDSYYALQFYKTTGSVKNIKITGADAAIYVNGSTVSLDGEIDVSGNHFGGIEVSKGSGVTTEPVLKIEAATLVNNDEANNIPTIWEDQIGTIGSANRVIGYGKMKVDYNQQTATNVQRFYYLDDKFEAPNEVVNPAVANVTTFGELKTAIENEEVKTINIKNNIQLDEKLQILSEKHIDGNGFTLTANSPTGWDSYYALQFYKTTGTVKDINITGADAAIYVNGSSVSLEGRIDVTGNQFGGIEVSKGSGVTTDPLLKIGTATLVNTDEANDIPTIWEDQIGTIESANRVIGYGSMKVDYNEKTATNIQRFYYLNKELSAPKQVVNPARAFEKADSAIAELIEFNTDKEIIGLTNKATPEAFEQVQTLINEVSETFTIEFNGKTVNGKQSLQLTLNKIKDLYNESQATGGNTETVTLLNMGEAFIIQDGIVKFI